LPAIFDAFRKARIIDPGFLKGRDAIARIDPGGREAIPGLVALLDHKHAMPVVLALAALAPYGPKGRPAIPAVERLAASGNRFIGAEAVKTLEALRAPRERRSGGKGKSGATSKGVQEP
jgi:hypothetical protein